jgi:hypothetical protein
MENEKVTVPLPVLSRGNANDVQSGPSYEMADMSAPTRKTTPESITVPPKNWVTKLWLEHVSLRVPAAKRRDHLGMQDN